MSEENNVTPEATETAAVQLGLNDLQATIQIIDVASTRGAFRGEELTSVGGVRDRIGAFLEANKPAEPEGDAAAERDTANAE